MVGGCWYGYRCGSGCYSALTAPNRKHFSFHRSNLVYSTGTVPVLDGTLPKPNLHAVQYWVKVLR